VSATFHARAVFGPPRPVLVLSVKGEIDRSNQGELDRALRAVSRSGAIVTVTSCGSLSLPTALCVDP
jgi:membrane-bound ClpP family serine protease